MERLEQVGTRLLAEFPVLPELPSLECMYMRCIPSVAERLAAIETRVRELESKL